MKYALIGGSQSGLAKATIAEFLKKDYFIFALDIKNEDKLDDRIYYLHADLTNNQDIERCKKIVEETTDSLDFLSSFAGTVILGSFIENAEGKCEKIFSINFFSTFNLVRVFAPMTIKAKGLIAIISSEYGKITSIPLHGYYTMTKHAIESYSDSLRRELQKSGVRITTIRPGAFKTPMESAVNRQFEELLEETKLYKKPLRLLKGLMVGELKKSKDPAILGKKLSKIEEKKHPKAHYNIKNSFKMKLLTALPSSLQDWIFSLFF